MKLFTPTKSPVADDTRPDFRGITFHPGMRSGAPTISGIRIPIETVLYVIWLDGLEAAMHSWDLTREQVLVAAWFAGTYGIDDTPTPAGRNRGGVWRKRYGQWAQSWSGQMWSGNFERVPDPPGDDS